VVDTALVMASGTAERDAAISTAAPRGMPDIRSASANGNGSKKYSGG
jgi:hypothetical protein